MTLAEELRWHVWIESIKTAMARGYSLSEIREFLADGGSLASLPSRGQDSTSTSNSINPDERASVPPFTQQELHNHIVALIVADDHVSLVQIERHRHLLTNYQLGSKPCRMPGVS